MSPSTTLNKNNKASGSSSSSSDKPKNSTHAERPKKLQRISQACDLCHRRSIRCRPSAENAQHQCQNCYDFAVDCTYNRPSRRRRNPSLAHVVNPNLLPSQQNNTSPTSPVVKLEDQYALNDTTTSLTTPLARYAGPNASELEDDRLDLAWRSFAVASHSTIERCLKVYMAIIYPMFPLFHGPTLWTRVRKRHHLVDRGFFASIMAACALAAARARDGATGNKQHFDDEMLMASETFIFAAQDAIFKDLSKAMGLGYLRACALLALTSIQHGHLQAMHQHMGHYHTLAAMQAFHDEEKWPANISIEEKEERRRLFWSMYSWDIYTSVVFKTVMKSSEAHSNVRYPTEVNDEDLSLGIASPTNELNWLRGWNFAVDLYRVLEHTLKRLERNKQQQDGRVSVMCLQLSDDVPDLQIMENILNLYYQLPARFKDYKVPVTGDRSQDIFGFQAANIQATLQLVRITLFQSSKWQDVHQKCDVAEQVLSTFHNIQPHYLGAISTPLVHHLGGIGQILASVMHGTLTEDSYQRVRSLLNSMADLLEGLESGLVSTIGASKGLRIQIDKIDKFMDVQREMLASFAQQDQQAGPPQTLPIPQSRPTITSMPKFVVPDGFGSSSSSTQDSLTSATTVASSKMPMNSLGMTTPLDEFQLPPDIIGEWPWPFDFMQEGIPAVNGLTTGDKISMPQGEYNQESAPSQGSTAQLSESE